MDDYLFRSDRLGFRNWKESDKTPLIAMNQDKVVMKYFPDILDEQESISFLKRQQLNQKKYGFCFFAVDLLSENVFIGFIGIQNIRFNSHFTPGIEIGWRLQTNYWCMGYASEGANKCVDYAKNVLGIKELFSFASEINIRSEKVMKKIGMQKIGKFNHPDLDAKDRLQPLVLYHTKLNP